MAVAKKPRIPAKTAGVAGKPPVPGPAALRQEIERRAYDLYLSRGGEPGDAEADWQRAERDVKQKYGLA